MIYFHSNDMQKCYLIPLWKIADDKVIQKNGIKSNLTQVKIYCVIKWVHQNNLIKSHLFENRNYVKSNRPRNFSALSAVTEILGDSWLATGKKPDTSRKLQ